MSDELGGKKIAILFAMASSKSTRSAQAGGRRGRCEHRVQAVEQDIEPIKKFTVDRALGDASAEDYAGLILPDGAVNPDETGVDMSSVTKAS